MPNIIEPDLNAVKSDIATRLSVDPSAVTVAFFQYLETPPDDENPSGFVEGRTWRVDVSGVSDDPFMVSHLYQPNHVVVDPKPGRSEAEAEIAGAFSTAIGL